jgi:hypothetical protein
VVSNEEIVRMAPHIGHGSGNTECRLTHNDRDVPDRVVGGKAKAGPGSYAVLRSRNTAGNVPGTASREGT